MNLRPIPKPKNYLLKKPSALAEYKFTGLEDVDDKILDYIDFKTLISLSKDNAYVKRLIKNNKKINDVIELLINNTTYDPHKDRYLLLLNNDKIEYYVINLLENDEVGQARKILDFSETKNHPLDIVHLDDELYVRLLDKIIFDKYLYMDEKLYENLLPLKPRNLTHRDTLIDILDRFHDNEGIINFLTLVIIISNVAPNDIELMNELRNQLSQFTDDEIEDIYHDMEEDEAETFMDLIEELRDMDMLPRKYKRKQIPIPIPRKF